MGRRFAGVDSLEDMQKTGGMGNRVLSEQVLNSLVNLRVVTHPIWCVGNGMEGEPQLVCAESQVVFVLCLEWRNPRLRHNYLVKISTVRELLKSLLKSLLQ